MNEFQIVREIGTGTTSRVCEAKDREGRTVALKIFSANTRALQWSGREEARLLSNLSHPNILRIEAFQENDPPTLVMEYIEGGSLQDRIQKQGPIYSRDALHLLKILSEAMLYAHAQGVVHGDLRPKNVLLRGGDPKKPVICDFGLSEKGTREEDAIALLSIFKFAAGNHPFLDPIKTPTISTLIRESTRGLSDSPIPSAPSQRKGCLGFLPFF